VLVVKNKKFNAAWTQKTGPKPISGNGIFFECVSLVTFMVHRPAWQFKRQMSKLRRLGYELDQIEQEKDYKAGMGDACGRPVPDY
jgi:hypothetical protein